MLVFFVFVFCGVYNIGWIEFIVFYDVFVWGMIGIVIVVVVVFSFFYDW